MEEEILALAGVLSGREAEAGLALLCEAARLRLEARLRQGVTVADCRAAFLTAAASEAAADWLEGCCGGEAVASYTAGAVSVRARGAGETLAAAAALRRQAARLMEPYVSDGGFCFCGVPG